MYCQFLLLQIHSTGHHQARMRVAGITITIRSDQWLAALPRQYISFPPSIDEDNPFHRSNLHAQGRWARYQTQGPARSGSSIFPPAWPQLGSTPGHPTDSYAFAFRYGTCRCMQSMCSWPCPLVCLRHQGLRVWPKASIAVHTPGLPVWLHTVAPFLLFWLGIPA